MPQIGAHDDRFANGMKWANQRKAQCPKASPERTGEKAANPRHPNPKPPKSSPDEKKHLWIDMFSKGARVPSAHAGQISVVLRSLPANHSCQIFVRVGGGCVHRVAE